MQQQVPVAESHPARNYPYDSIGSLIEASTITVDRSENKEVKLEVFDHDTYKTYSFLDTNAKGIQIKVYLDQNSTNVMIDISGILIHRDGTLDIGQYKGIDVERLK